MDEGVAEGVALLVDEQEVVLSSRAQPGIEHVGGQLDGRGEQAMADPPPADGRRPDHRWAPLSRRSRRASSSSWRPGGMLALAGDGGELLGEERVAVGALEHGADERVRWLRAEDAAQLLGDVARAERRQAQVFDTLGAVELGEQATNRVAALETVEAIGRHEHHAGQRRAAGEHGEQVASRSVGPVDVLDDEQHRPLGGDATQRRRQRLRRPASAPGCSPSWSEHLVDRGVRARRHRRRRDNAR